MDSLITGKLLIKVRHIEKILTELGLKLWRNGLLKKLLRLNVAEPRMTQNLLHISRGSKSVLWRLGKALSYKIFAVFCHGDSMLLSIREEHWLCLDKVIHLLIVWRPSVEWWETNDHLVGQNSEGPPIDREGVTFLIENLRSKVFRGTAE